MNTLSGCVTCIQLQSPLHAATATSTSNCLAPAAVRSAHQHPLCWRLHLTAAAGGTPAGQAAVGTSSRRARQPDGVGNTLPDRNGQQLPAYHQSTHRPSPHSIPRLLSGPMFTELHQNPEHHQHSQHHQNPEHHQNHEHHQHPEHAQSPERLTSWCPHMAA